MSLSDKQRKCLDELSKRKWDVPKSIKDSVKEMVKAFHDSEDKMHTFQKRYDYHISQKYEAMAGNYDGWSSSADAVKHHALCASLVYQDALTAGIRLKVEGE
ncbi:hypothetical protein ASG46_06050 [Bacillus sp. Leaf49]|uniref:hypothetical protein n=1 Tax=Bacillus TaxID=1386 RepID=UPI0006F90D8E|nr:hypothetical protein [Bacillus sp. Leaf49]KQU12099.1 hypothetical protein ASG46_06050 [Bacillus sp. Leaf49]